MNEQSGGDGVGVIDDTNSVTGVAKGEVAVGEPKTVPIAMRVIGHDGTERDIKDNFTLLRGIDASHGHLTTNPHFLAKVLERGPLAFDEAREQGQDPTQLSFMVMEEIDPELAKEREDIELTNITVDSDGNIIYTSERIKHIEAFETDPVTTLVVEGGQNTSRTIRDIKPMVFDGQKYAYPKIPQLQEAYLGLGLRSGFLNGEGIWSLPPPRLFAERLNRFRDEDNESGLYYPELEIFEQGKITSKDFVSAFAAGKFPVSGISFDLYVHDVAQEHFQAVMVYGEPLMDLVQNFAQAMQNFESITLPNFDGSKIDRPNITDLQGKDKDDATGRILDDMTAKLIGRDFKTLYEDEPFERYFDQVAYALRKAGRLGNLRVVTDILESGEAADVDQITGRMIADKLITSTREKFKIAA